MIDLVFAPHHLLGYGCCVRLQSPHPLAAAATAAAVAAAAAVAVGVVVVVAAGVEVVVDEVGVRESVRDWWRLWGCLH